jgi:hypothetical protein
MGGDQGEGQQNAKRNMLSLPKPLPVKAFRNKRILLKGGAFEHYSPFFYKYYSPPERFIADSIAGIKIKNVFLLYSF